jgi:hypothetical protein
MKKKSTTWVYKHFYFVYPTKYSLIYFSPTALSSFTKRPFSASDLFKEICGRRMGGGIQSVHSCNADWLTPWSTALFQKHMVTQLVKKLPTLYESRKFITVLRARHWSLSRARCIQSTFFHPISLRSVLKLSPHLRLGLQSGLFPSDFPTRILHEFLVFLMRAICYANLISRSVQKGILLRSRK